ncbi:MAG: FeoA family protein [Planctomycetota bacterium]
MEKNLTALSDIGEGTAAVIVKVGGKGKLRRRLLEMGFVPGAEVAVVKHAPLRDPWEYRIKGSHVMLRHEEAAEILVEIRE